MNLKQKTISGLFWSFFSQGGRQVSQLIVTAVLARLLLPNDFGTLAMVTVFSNFASIFGEMGIGSALVQKQNTHDRHYYSAFWLNIFVGVILTLIFMAASPLIAWFYKKPELIPILQVVALNFVLSSFTIIQQTVLTKEMDFKSLAIRDILAVIFSGGVGVFLAYRGFGVWSLVYQMLGFTIINAILLWVLSSWRPRLQFALSDIKDILHFSANLTGFNILNYFARNMDQLLIGKFLGSQALGYYSLAYKIMLYPLQNISWVIVKVMFPAFSKVQHDLEKVRSSYIKMVRAIAVVTFPLMVGLFVLAPEVVGAFLGAKWYPIVGIIRVFCICGLVQSIQTTAGSLILSQGRADLQFKLGALNSFFAVLAITIGLRWGILGVAVCYTLEQLLWACYVQPLVNSLIELKLRDFLVPLLKILCITMAMGSVVYSSKAFLYFQNGSGNLAFQILIGLIFYLVVISWMNKDLLLLFRGNKVR